TDLLIERVKQLLAGGRSGECGSLIESSTEPTLIAKSFRSAIEGDAKSIHQVDNSRSPEGHFLDGGLMLQEVAAVNGIVEMEPLVVSLLTGQLVDAIDSALGTHTMG